LDLAGAENSATHDFRSLLAPESDIHPFTVAENTAPKSLNNMVARMLRTDQYKYIWKSNQEHELYDLTHDPAEAHNLFAARPDLTRVLADQLERWELTLEGQHIEKSEAEFDEATLQHLRGLGYVG
jgi:arylsulfatase A-like enzyme